MKTKVELQELLKERNLIHPCKIRDVHSNGEGALEIKLEGISWWRNADLHCDDILILRFEGMGQGYLRVDDFFNNLYQEDVEELSVEWIENETRANLFCSAPLKDPFQIVRVVFNYSAPGQPAPLNYLNMGLGNLDTFAKIVTSSSYLLFEGPVALADLIAMELDKQSIPNNTVTREFSAKYYRVQIGDSRFICEKAYALFDS